MASVMEEIFDEIKIPYDALKPKLASCTLTLNVARWWKMVRKHYQTEGMKWELFTIVFYRHFYNEIEERIMRWKIQKREKWLIDFQRSIERQKRQKKIDEQQAK